MTRSIGTLGDFFPATDIRCRVRGCNNVWQFSDTTGAATDTDRPERMCDACYERYRQLEDRQIPCAAPDCDRTWTWPRHQQLEARTQGRREEPRELCETCRQRLDAKQDRKVPCRIRTCTRTWIWSRRDQFLSATDTPPARLCEACYKHLRTLHDAEVPCRAKGCPKTWTWNRYEQLTHMAAGKSVQSPPQRMCKACYDSFRGLQDRELPCKVEGCTRSWRFNRYEQLEHSLADSAEIAPSNRMCPECFRFYAQSVSKRITCRHRGCSHTWKYTRTMQLQDWLHGRQPQNGLCDECTRRIAAAKPRAVPCMVPGCAGTCPYTAADQVRDACMGKPAPSTRRCTDCEEFLAAHSATELQCAECGSAIPWSAYQQLLCERGTFAKPTRCANCTEEALHTNTPKEKPRTGHHHVVRMPAAGAWQKNERIQEWPPHLTYDTIQEVEHANACIVALGDDLTWSMATAAESWPFLLQQQLNETLGRRRRRVAVVNAGIPMSTSAESLDRFGRDVAPFAPCLVIFAFPFADALLRLNRDQTEWRPNIDPEHAEEAAETLCRRLAAARIPALHWTPNPMFPQDRVGDRPSAALAAWVKAQTAADDQNRRRMRKVCRSHQIPVLDLYARFEVNGTRSARKWMADWYRHNAAGARNVAAWFSDYILRERLLKL